MPQNPTLTAMLVRDYDEAIVFYVGMLGFALCEGTPLPAGKRWVVRPPGSRSGLLLARAVGSGRSRR